jgi:MFS family permease
MLLAFCLICAVVTVPLAGGRFRRIADLRLRRTWVVAAALAIQVLIVSVVPTADPVLLACLHLLSYALAGVFLVANRHIPGWWLIGLGGVLNLAAIAANNGVMPASASAAATAGLLDAPGQFANSSVVADPNFAWLGDVFALPASWPLHNVFSIGDICLALGAAIALHGLAGSRLAPSPDGDFASLMRERDFVRVWAAQGISNLGDWVYALAVAVTLVRRAGTPHALAFLLVAQVGPAAVTGILGGHVVDRFSRKAVMIVSDVVRAAAVGSLLLAGSPALVHLYAVAACLGICEAVFGPSVLAALPNLVARDRIVAANSLMAGTYNFAVLSGPILGGIVVVGLGVGGALALNALTFVVSALLLSTASLGAPERSELHTARAQLVEGLRYARSSRFVRGVLAVTGMVMLAAALRSPLEPLFVLRTLEGTPRSLGLLGAAWGLGMVVGALGAPAAARRWPRERLLAFGIAAVGAAVLAASRAATIVPVFALWIVSGFGNALGTVSYESLLQERTPDRLRGRTMAASEAVLNAAFLAGAALSGWLAEHAGIRFTYALSGSLFLVVAVVSRIVLHERDAPRLAASQPPGPLAPSGPREAEPVGERRS